MSRICRLPGAADADSATASMRCPGFHEGPTAHRCMGLPLTQGGSSRGPPAFETREAVAIEDVAIEDLEKLHKEIKQ